MINVATIPPIPKKKFPIKIKIKLLEHIISPTPNVVRIQDLIKAYFLP